MYRRVLLPAVGLGALAAGIVAGPRLWIRRLAQRSGDVLYFVDTDQRLVSLTIDDGPHRALTPGILDVLAEHDARATFFLLGERVPGNEHLVSRMVAEGHELGNHLMSDAPSIRLTPAEFEVELLQAHTILADFARPRWFRPGSGWYNRRMLDQLAAHNYHCVLGSIYPYDAHVPYPNLISTYVLNNVFPGGIIALHDGSWDRRHSLEVLRTVLPELKSQGYRVVTLSELAEGAGA